MPGRLLHCAPAVFFQAEEEHSGESRSGRKRRLRRHLSLHPSCGYQLDVQSVSLSHHALNAMDHNRGKRLPEAIRPRTRTPSHSGSAPAHDDRSHSTLARKPTMLTTQRTSAESGRSASDRPRAPGILLGIGLGGFVDGIVLHQVLQWHHMLSGEGSYPTTTVAGLETNTLWDGLFHAATWVAVAVGLDIPLAAHDRLALGDQRTRLHRLAARGLGPVQHRRGPRRPPDPRHPPRTRDREPACLGPRVPGLRRDLLLIGDGRSLARIRADSRARQATRHAACRAWVRACQPRRRERCVPG